MKNSILFIVTLLSLSFTVSTFAMIHHSLLKIIPVKNIIRYSIIKSQHRALHTQEIEKLKALFPEKVLQRVIKVNTTKNPINRLKEEWIKYAYMVKVHNRTFGMFSKEVDDLWHIFLLFSKDYEIFCSHLPSKEGKSFLYHNPHDEVESCPTRCQWVQKLQFIQAYQDLYQEFPNKAIWTALNSCLLPHCLNKNEQSPNTNTSNTSGSAGACNNSTVPIHNTSTSDSSCGGLPFIACCDACFDGECNAECGGL